MNFKVGDYCILLKNEPSGARETYAGDLLIIEAIIDGGKHASISARLVRKPSINWSYCFSSLHNLGLVAHIPPLIKALYDIK